MPQMWYNKCMKSLLYGITAYSLSTRHPRRATVERYLLAAG